MTPPPAQSDRRATALLAIGWAALTAFAFAGTLDAFFAQDDFWLLQAAQQPLPHRGMFAGTLPDYVRPLTTFWFPWCNVRLFGLDPLGHHLTLLLVHAAATGMLFLALRRWTGSLLGACLGAAIYALSEVHLVTLGWLAGAGDPLCALGMSVALWAIAAERPWTAVAGVVFALLSKEHAAVLPVAFAATAGTMRCIDARPRPGDRRMLRALAITGALYLTYWFAVAARGGAGAIAIGFDPTRTALVLRHSLLVVLPGIDHGDAISSLWIAAPPLLAAATFALGSAPARRVVVFGFWLWLGAAALFALTTRPAFLEHYYAHFSVVGLALLAAAAGRTALDRARAHRWPGIALLAALLLYTGWSTAARRRDVAAAETPSLRSATFSRPFAEALAAAMREHGARHVLVLEASDDVWWATGKGALVPALHPATTVMFAGIDPESARPEGAQIVLRQTGERTFEVVR